MEDFPILQNKCGSCTMCCKLMGVDEFPEKKIGEWCQYCDIGKGCKIYESRPPSCQNFECLWLSSNWMPELRPDKSKIVFFTPMDTYEKKIIQAKCDPSYPKAYLNNPTNLLIDTICNSGFSILMTVGNKRKVISSDPMIKYMGEHGLAK